MRAARIGGGCLLGRWRVSLLVAFAFAAVPGSAAAALGDISTVAGGVPPGPIAATSVGQQPQGVATASFGGHSYTYVADLANADVTRIDDSTGEQRVIAGLGASSFSGDGGPATQAGIAAPSGVAVDPAGDVAIAGGDRIRFIPAISGTYFGRSMTAGDIYTVAGNGNPGYTGDGGPATSANINDGPQFFLPGGGVAFDPAGNLAIADSGNNVVRLVARQAGHPFGLNTTAGDIYLVAGNNKGAVGFAGDGATARNPKLNTPLGVAFDANGDMAVADTENERVRFVPQSSGTLFSQAVVADDIYTIGGDGSTTSACTAQNVGATSVGLSLPTGLSFDGTDGVLVAETDADCVAFIQNSTTGFCAAGADSICSVVGDGTPGFSGDGGPPTGAQLTEPMAVSFDPGNGGLAVADFFNGRIRWVTAATGSFFGQGMMSGNLYTVAGNGSTGFSGDGLPADASELSNATGVAVGPSGEVGIADFSDNRIRYVPPATGTFFGQSMTAAHMYTLAGDGAFAYAGDGGPATSAKLGEPGAVQFDRHGDAVIADRFNHAVRFVPASSSTFFGKSMAAAHIYTIAGDGTGGYNGDGGAATSAELQQPNGVFMDPGGNVVIADTDNARVRFVPASSGMFFGQSMTATHIYTIAGNGTSGFGGDGGPATSAMLHSPEDVAEDAAGDLFITDGNNNRVRFVPASSGTFFGQSMTAGDIYTIVGDGTAGSIGDGGPPAAAEVSFPVGIAVDSIGDVAIADEGGQRVRFIPTRSGVYFGPSMTAGDIYTIAGTGKRGFNGDGIAATGSQLSFPDGVAFDGSGDVLISDSGNHRIRMVQGTIPTNGGGSPAPPPPPPPPPPRPPGPPGPPGPTGPSGPTGPTGGPDRARLVHVAVHGTKVVVAIVCSGSAAAKCSINLKLSVTERLRGGKLIAVSAAAHRRRTVTKVVVVGTAKLTLSGSQRKTVTISLNRAGGRLLAHRLRAGHRTLQVTLTIVQGRNRIYRHRLTLVKPKPKPKPKPKLKLGR